MDYSLEALLAQNNDQWHEQTIYCLSRTMTGAEHLYNLVEKECLALVITIQKMGHYLVGQTIHIISKVNTLILLMTKTSSLMVDCRSGLSYSHNKRCNSFRRKPWRDKPWRISLLNIQIQEQPNFMKISQMRLLKFAWPRHSLRNKSGNYSFMEH